MSSARKLPVTGTFVAVANSAGFTPEPYVNQEIPFNVSIWGAFVASVRMTRSFDGGTTWLPITAAGTSLYAWTAPASEAAQETEVSVLYRLECTAWTSGTVNYRISQ